MDYNVALNPTYPIRAPMPEPPSWAPSCPAPATCSRERRRGRATAPAQVHLGPNDLSRGFSTVTGGARQSNPGATTMVNGGASLWWWNHAIGIGEMEREGTGCCGRGESKSDGSCCSNLAGTRARLRRSERRQWRPSLAFVGEQQRGAGWSAIRGKPSTRVQALVPNPPRRRRCRSARR